MQNLFNRNLVAVAVGTALVVSAAAYVQNQDTSGTVQISAEKQAFLAHKQQQKQNNPKRFDKPQEAIDYYIAQRAPIGSDSIPYHKYGAALKHMEQMSRFSMADKQLMPSLANMPEGDGPGVIQQWENLGPGNIGGRVRELLIDPNDANVMYTAAVAGGVWKTMDGGASWMPLDDAMANLAVSSMAMHHDNSSVIYAGTGEGFFNGDAVRGDGVFVSMDAGASWTQLASTANNSDFRYVNKIRISPTMDGRLYAATRGGLLRSDDSGETWTKLFETEATEGCLDLTVTASGETDTLVFSCGSFNPATVYQSTDAGDTIAAVIEDEFLGRTTLAVAPSDSNIVYALSATNGNDETEFRYGFYKLHRSDDGGATWTMQSSNQSENPVTRSLLSNTVYTMFPECGFGPDRQYFNQGWYDNIIAVDPVNPDRIFVGGIDVARSDDAGVNFGSVTRWWADTSLPDYGHADQHVITFHPDYNGTDNTTVYIGNDGGIQVSMNATADVFSVNTICGGGSEEGQISWQMLNNGLDITQFYHGAVFPDGSAYFGGTQDNGTILRYATDSEEQWFEIAGGDGGWVAVDPVDGSIYQEYTGLSLQRWSPGIGWQDATNGINEGAGFPFITPFAMDMNQPSRLWIGNDYLWRTDDQGRNWVRASMQTSDGSIINEWGVAPGNSDFVMAGTRSGKILMSMAATTATAETQWTEVQVSEGRISDIAISDVDNNVAYATVSTFGQPHVMKTMDGGVTWMAVDNMGAMNGLPDIPANTIVIDPANNERVYVGTDLGVFISVDGGMNWSVDGSGFANTPVAHLDIVNGQLYAFTHGRSAYRVDLSTLPSANSVSFMTDEDMAYSFSADSFGGFSGGTPEFDAVVFSKLPMNGHFELDGAEYTILSPIAREDLSKLKFVPDANFNGEVMLHWGAHSKGADTSTKGSLSIMVNPVNDAPEIEVDYSMVMMASNNTSSRTITPSMINMIENEADQTITYSISPEIPSFLNAEFDAETGKLKVMSNGGAGSVEFTVTADDGQAENNTGTANFTVTVVDAIPEPVVTTQSSGGGGGSTGLLALLSLPLLALRRRFKKA